MKKTKVFQIKNDYIQEEFDKQKQKVDENRQKNRFMGVILVLAMFLFILPTYNLVESYQSLQEKEQRLIELEKQYEQLSQQERIESTLVTKLKDEEYIKKYIRAKLLYSKDGEIVYNIPGLLPK